MPSTAHPDIGGADSNFLRPWSEEVLELEKPQQREAAVSMREKMRRRESNGIKLP